jgi:hypothetical protein
LLDPVEGLELAREPDVEAEKPPVLQFVELGDIRAGDRAGFLLPGLAAPVGAHRALTSEPRHGSPSTHPFLVRMVVLRW